MALPKAPKASRTAKRAAAFGAARGASLAQSAAALLLVAYNNQQGPVSPASEQWWKAWEALQSALNARTNEPAVAAALRALDGAYGDALVECEDRAWHAAWHAAMGLITGATFSQPNSHHVNAIGSRKASD